MSKDMNPPVNKEVNVPLRSIIETVLRYEDPEMGYNPFCVNPTASEGGAIAMDITPDDPESLDLNAYRISYVWKMASQQELSELDFLESGKQTPYGESSPIANLFGHKGISTTINWNHIKWEMFPQARDGYRKLETLISSLESE